MIMTDTHCPACQSGDTMTDDLPHDTDTERAALCEYKVTLNGERAKVTGYRLAFARVTQHGTGLGCEYAWPTVAHVIANGGRFRS